MNAMWECAFTEQLEKTGDIRVLWNSIVFSFHSEKFPPCTGQILPTCKILHDASAPAQFDRARSGDKDQGEPTVLSQHRFQGLSSFRPLVGRRKTLRARLLESVLVGQRSILSQPWPRCSSPQSWEDTSKNPRKDGSIKSSMQSRNEHDFFTKIVLQKHKKLDDISVPRIKILFLE